MLEQELAHIVAKLWVVRNPELKLKFVLIKKELLRKGKGESKHGDSIKYGGGTLARKWVIP